MNYPPFNHSYKFFQSGCEIALDVFQLVFSYLHFRKSFLV